MWGLRETGQHYCDRTKQHQGDVKNKKQSNGLYDHLKNNQGQKINLERVRFLDKEDRSKQVDESGKGV